METSERALFNIAFTPLNSKDTDALAKQSQHKLPSSKALSASDNTASKVRNPPTASSSQPYHTPPLTRNDDQPENTIHPPTISESVAMG